MHVKKNDCFRGLLVPKEEFSVPPPTARKRRSYANSIVEEKGKEKVSTSALTMIDLVGLGVEIHPNKQKSTLSDSSSHMHNYIGLPKNPKDVIKDNVESSFAIQEEIRGPESRIDDSEIPSFASNVVLPESVLSENVNVILLESGLAVKENTVLPTSNLFQKESVTTVNENALYDLVEKVASESLVFVSTFPISGLLLLI